MKNILPISVWLAGVFWMISNINCSAFTSFWARTGGCAAGQLKMEKGVFFHAVYRIQQKLGRAFRELKPYPLFPLDEYFGAVVRKELPEESRRVLRMPLVEKRRGALRPPLRKVA